VSSLATVSLAVRSLPGRPIKPNQCANGDTSPAYISRFSVFVTGETAAAWPIGVKAKTCAGHQSLITQFPSSHLARNWPPLHLPRQHEPGFKRPNSLQHMQSGVDLPSFLNPPRTIRRRGMKLPLFSQDSNVRQRKAWAAKIVVSQHQ